MGVSWGSDTLRNILFGLVDIIVLWLNGILDAVVIPAANIDIIGHIRSENSEIIVGFITVSMSVIVLTAIYQLIIASLSPDIHKRIVNIFLGAVIAAILSASSLYLLPWFSEKFVATGELSTSLAGAVGGTEILQEEVLTKTVYGFELCGWDNAVAYATEDSNSGNSMWNACVRKHKDLILQTGGTEDTLYQRDFIETWVNKQHVFELKGSGFNNFISVKTLIAANPRMTDQEAKDMVIEIVNGTFNYNQKAGGGWFNGGKYIYQINEIPTFIIGIIAVCLMIVVSVQILNRSFGLAFFFLALPFAAASLCTEEKKAIKALGSQIWLCFIMNLTVITTIVLSFVMISWFQTTSGLFNFILILSALLFILNVPQYISMMIGAQGAGLMGGIYSIMMAVNTSRMAASTGVNLAKGVAGGLSNVSKSLKNGASNWSSKSKTNSNQANKQNGSNKNGANKNGNSNNQKNSNSSGTKNEPNRTSARPNSQVAKNEVGNTKNNNQQSPAGKQTGTGSVGSQSVNSRNSAGSNRYGGNISDSSSDRGLSRERQGSKRDLYSNSKGKEGSTNGRNNSKK